MGREHGSSLPCVQGRVGEEWRDMQCRALSAANSPLPNPPLHSQGREQNVTAQSLP